MEHLLHSVRLGDVEAVVNLDAAPPLKEPERWQPINLSVTATHDIAFNFGGRGRKATDVCSAASI
jgi:hypothetical protein